jgi:hypothetical protein
MSHVLPFKGPSAETRHVPRLLYIGPAADELCHILSTQIGRIDVAYETEVQAAFAQLRRRQFDIVIVDQRDENLATHLILPVLQSLGYPIKPVVISPLKEVSHYLAVPGVARVLSAPVKEAQLLRVLGLERRQRELKVDPLPAAEASSTPKTLPKKTIVQHISDRFMSVVSTAYKRSAFVLLALLFVAFAFYGVLIAFFLLSSGWGAPLTLTRGHELVNKLEGQMTEVSVALHQTEQKLSDVALAKSTAEKELEEANSLVTYAQGTIKAELVAGERRRKAALKALKRLETVRKQFASQIDDSAAKRQLDTLFKRRLINRNSYSTSVMNMIDASDKIASLETQVDEAQTMLAEIEADRDMLTSLLSALKKGRGIADTTASSNALLLLAKQSSDAVAARDIAKSKLEAAANNETALSEALKTLISQLGEFKKSPMARALEQRVDVVFVPYGNEGSYQEGDALYSCAFTIVACSKVGVVGKALPGESSAVHPFFGKPIRGSFVEMKLSSPDAAMREIIHGKRRPLFFF